MDSLSVSLAFKTSIANLGVESEPSKDAPRSFSVWIICTSVAIIFQVAFWTWLAGVIDDPDIDVGPYLPFGHNSDGFSVRAYIISTAPTAVLAPSAAAALLAIFLDHRGRWDEDGLMLRWCWRYAVLNALGSLTWPALIANYAGGPFVHSGIQVVIFCFLPLTHFAFFAAGFMLLWCNVCKLRALSFFEEAHQNKMIWLTICPSQLGVFGVACVATQVLTDGKYANAVLGCIGLVMLIVEVWVGYFFCKVVGAMYWAATLVEENTKFLLATPPELIALLEAARWTRRTSYATALSGVTYVIGWGVTTSAWLIGDSADPALVTAAVATTSAADFVERLQSCMSTTISTGP